jgi:hypothetical protein
MTCDRCGQKTTFCTGSYFNTELICADCDRREQEHPLFEEAREVEREAVRGGDFNFPGIGLPAELQGAP